MEEKIINITLLSFLALFSFTSVGYTANNYNQHTDLNLSISETWHLVFRQTAPFYQSKDAWRLHNENDPSNDNYSILEQIDDTYKGADGKFHFKFIWPGSSFPQNQEWKQTSNPVTATSGGVTGYEAVDINYTSNLWGGLEYNTGGSSLIDGTVNHGNWYYAVGSTGSWGGGIPGPASPAVNIVELYAFYGCDGEVDQCGVCEGDGTSCLDCAGIPFGDNVMDFCGECDSDPSNDASSCGWDLVAFENAGNQQNLLYIGIDSGDMDGSIAGNIGPSSLEYDEVLITAGDYYYMFKPAEDIFENSVALHMDIIEWETNDDVLDGWVEQDGGIEFCRASSSPNIRPGDTTWGLIPSGSQQRSCGCNSGGWSGYGAYYGGFASDCTVCGCQGGGWSGTTASGQNKGAGGYDNVDLKIYVRTTVYGCDYNDDGVVDILDLVAMIHCILIDGCFDGTQCDWNTDGNLDIMDVVSIIDCILPIGCYQDCAGVWGGDSVEDECGVCEGDGPEVNYDCDGNCIAEYDCAGVCGGDGSLCGINLLSLPQPLHFYARDLTTNNCSFIIEGETIGVEVEGNVLVTVTRDGSPFFETMTGDTQFAIDITIDSGLYLYEVIVTWDNGTNNWETVATIEDITCGDVFLINGQSNSVASDYHNENVADEGMNIFVRSFGSAANNSSVENYSNFVIAVAEAGHTQGSIGQWGMQLANEIMNNQSMPILVINGAVGGTRVDQHQRNDSNPEDLNTIYGRLLWRVNQANVAESVRAIFWHQGESDGTMAFDTYFALWTSMYEDWLEDYPNLDGIYPFQVRAGCGNPTWNRNVHRELPELLPLVTGNMSTSGVDGHDGCHFYNQTYVEWGNRMARLINRDLYGNTLNNIEAPNPMIASWIEPTKLEINYGSTGEGLILQTGAISYFSLSDGSTIINAEVVENTVVLTTDAPSNANWVSLVDIPGDIPWLINELGIGSFAYYQFPIE